MEEYKGIYYGDEVEQKYYEGGAHFKYSKLYKILEILSRERIIKEQEKEKEKELLFNYPKNKNKNNLNENKITRNIISNIDNKNFSYNTIGNNRRNDKNHKNIFLPISKGINREENKNNFSLSKYKKDAVDSRNKDSIKAYRGRPNTKFKDKYQKIFLSNRNRLLSSSVEQKNSNKYNNLINLKNSLPELNSNKLRNLHNYNTYKKKGIIKEFGQHSKNKNKSKFSKNNNIRNVMKNDIQQNIYNFNMKTEKMNQHSMDISHKKIRENYTEIKDGNKRLRHLFLQGLNFRISEKTHNIINKRILNNKNAQMNMRTNRLYSSEIFIKSKSKSDKDNRTTYINRSNKKKNIKKDFNIHNNAFLERTNYKNNKYYSILRDSRNNYLLNTIKNDKNNNYIKLDNNVFLFNRKLIKRSRNEKGNNILIRDKHSLNYNNNINDRSKVKFNDSKENNNYKTDFNNTYAYKRNAKIYLNKSNNTKKLKLNYNYLNGNKFISKSNHRKKDNNETSISNSNEIYKSRNNVEPLINKRKIKRIKYKVNNNGNTNVN